MHILTAIPTFDSANFDMPSTGTKISAQKTRPAVPNNILDKPFTSWVEYLPIDRGVPGGLPQRHGEIGKDLAG